jgi:PIN domain nuclease of toxin-antitoxin system
VRLLLDTHALIWWFLDDARLTDRVGALLDDPKSVVFVSAASAWELTTKYRAGKLQDAAELAEQLLVLIKQWRFTPLPITVEHGHRAGLLPGDHKDPFDRMLVAQALIEDLDVVTADPALATLGARVMW